ncbi:MAG: 50S ribosomal protein L20 [Ignavibacteria bacterium RBG_13_36_8]|nr:MAG: 50S ribosomal protein L20 [Ignavibacteria bacterium RBG_13_36_8]
MPRATNKVASRKRRKKILGMAKGYWGARSKVYTIAKTHVEKGLQHAFTDRKTKKRTFRQLWIVRINAAARMHGISYSKLINGLREKGVDINRKILANLAVENPEAFAEIVNFIKK